MIKKLLRNLVLVKQDVQGDVTEGGIHIPSSVAKEEQPTGTVILVGGDIKDITVGDRVMFLKFVGADLEMDGQTYRCLKEVDVLGIL